jgi:hypothetical protein
VPGSFCWPAKRIDEALSEDLESRFEAAFRTIWALASRTRQCPALWRRGLERPPGESVARKEEAASSIRAGRQVRWLRNALVQARERMDQESFERLVAAVCLCVEIESLVVLRDVWLGSRGGQGGCPVGGLRASPGQSQRGRGPDGGSFRRSQDAH